LSGTVVERIVQDRRKQHYVTPFEIHRSIDVSQDGELLLIQDRFAQNGGSNVDSVDVVPAPPVVTPDFTDNVIFNTTDNNSALIQSRAHAHWGNAVWMIPEKRGFSEGFSTLIVVDVGNSLASVTFPVELVDEVVGAEIETENESNIFPGPNLGK